MTTKLWKFLDIREWNLKSTIEVAKTGSDSAKAVFDLAKTVKEKSPSVETLKPFVEKISSLLDVLNSPIAQIAKDTIPFAPIALTILDLILKTTNKNPTLEQCVALVAQVAYLDSLRSLLRNDPTLLARIGEAPISDAVAQQIKALGDYELSDRDAETVLTVFHESQLAKAFNSVLEARLQNAGLTQPEARTISDRVSWTVPRYLNQAVADAAEKIKPLAERYRNGGQEVLKRYKDLEDYLEAEIKRKPDETVLNDRDLNLTFREIYVRLQAQRLDRNGRRVENAESVDLETWVEERLNDTEKQILFVQGEAGRGKSMFCRMFSDRVRRELYPSFMPVVIRLRHLRHLENTLTQTLEDYLEPWSFTKNSDWLTDRNTRFLFLLDGFDELLLEGRASGGLQEFLQQVAQFQSNSHHRFLITGRPLSLQGIDRIITQTKNLERVAIDPMNDQIRQQWIDQWAIKVGSESAMAFSEFLQSCPDTVKNDLAREPLLLYLLAKLHRAGQLTMEMLESGNETQTKVAIYDVAVSWVLREQRENENFRLTGLEPDDLRQILTEAALCVVQAGNESAPISMLEARLSDSKKALIQQARQETKLDARRSLNNLLTAFYIQPGSLDRTGSVEFMHKSFGEFLCAERLRDAIEDWTRPGIRREKFLVSSKQLREEIYDLLGSPVLSVEIVTYLMALLHNSSDFRPVELFNRLHDEFYLPWCDGEFIDALPDENFPQRKMRALKEQLPDQEKPLGIRQVDVYTGLNILILLLKLHQYAQAEDALKASIIFYPDGKPVQGETNLQLRKIISYSNCVSLGEFIRTVGAFLNNANLTSANLDNANLVNANLTNANLVNANLVNANLVNANLNNANLTNANLDNAYLVNANLDDANLDNVYLAYANLAYANLINANLVNANLAYANLVNVYLANDNLANTNLAYANLVNAYLVNANLTNANLNNAILNNANLANTDLTNANLRGIVWDERTNWKEARGLETARNVPEALKQHSR